MEYGLISLIHMDKLPQNQLVSARELAELFHMPVEILGKVLQALSKAAFIESAHGSKGGYRILRSLEDLSLGEVEEVLSGTNYMVPCQDEPNACDQYCTCNIRDPVIRIQAQLTRFMHGIKLSAFRHSEHTAMFDIPVATGLEDKKA